MDRRSLVKAAVAGMSALAVGPGALARVAAAQCPATGPTERWVARTPTGSGCRPGSRRGSWPARSPTGPAFSPDGGRLYVSSQRGNGFGITYEVRGPFR